MKHSWDILNAYRGKLVQGDWPTIPELFLISLERHPDRACFTVFDPGKNTLTYRDVHREIMRIAGYLIEAGVKPGEKVVLTGANSPQWGLAYLAILFAGAVAVPLDTQMAEQRMLELGQFSDSVFLFADYGHVEKFDKSHPWFRSLKGVVLLRSGKGKKQTTYSDIMNIKPQHAHERVLISSDSVAAILFTSGTTGNEKGAILTHTNLTSDAYQACDGIFLNISHEDVFYVFMPLHHSYCTTAVFLESILHGSEAVFGSSMAVTKLLSDMKTGHVTIFLGIPLLYNKLLAGLMKKVREKGLLAYGVIRLLMKINGILKRRFGINMGKKWFKTMLSGIGMLENSICICGAGPLAPQVFRQFQQLGLDFIQGYGLTEASPILTLNPVSKFKIDSIGMIFPLVEMKVDSPNASGVGELVVKGPNICQGYYKDPKQTAELFTKDGYMRTGDLGSIDEENYVYLKGRIKNMIVTDGGKNVYPEEIEDGFQLYPQVEQVLVRGYIADKALKKEAIEVLIFPNSDYYKGKGITDKTVIRKDLEKVVAEVNRTLVAYKKISRIIILDEAMDMTSTKKIKRTSVGHTEDVIA
ncbi:AMP-dependent synthetase/ligase [Parasphaerochaeta coccoides]|uniref:Long-chain-fatty-acid--CoA ligase n=1 Tax=Parasphaerochaeta coccoides (strain ATCC BAA-1237 / DSM 17374 / SPN1) TaxID=760011 RepID=F4GJD7_PARC1|nr:AMP-binding protein [Parasphaerochaeta coccoides]AEC02202.1 Long-chain-fatty-acid--CoA ligase [Parasphaerochaeta coccoides DSM 17374]